MTQMNLDDELYRQVKEFVQENNIEYPSLTNFVERATKEKLRIELIRSKENE